MSKDLFFQMRAEDFVTIYSEDFSKKKAEAAGKQLVKDIFERGEADPIKVFSNIARLKAVIDSADKLFRERLSLPSESSYNGVTFTPKNGSEKLNYEEDDLCRSLSEKLKARQELVKMATKSKDLIFDADGCQVTNVSSKFDKSSIAVSF